jgi:hypothetical protein
MTWIEDQLRLLYGPLSFFTFQNQQLSTLSKAVQAEGQNFFHGETRVERGTRNNSVLLGCRSDFNNNLFD